MVAITVILAAVIGTFVLGLGDQVDSTPQASFDFDVDEDAASELTITHSGGDSIQKSDISVQVGGNDATINPDGVDSFTNFDATRVQAGSTATADLGSNAPGKTVNIVYISEGEGSVLASYEIDEDAELS